MIEPEQILQNYREALRNAYGDEVADKSNLYYNRGWYYISVARKVLITLTIQIA